MLLLQERANNDPFGKSHYYVNNNFINNDPPGPFIRIALFFLTQGRMDGRTPVAKIMTTYSAGFIELRKY